MELRNLRYFWTVAEENSISKAAIVLNITQPTLSRQLKDLESQLGTELFYRGSKGIILTEDGLFLKNRAEEILSLINKTERDFESKKNQELSGHLTIGCVEADNSDTLAMILEELTRDHPKVTFHIISGTSTDITESIDKGVIDIAILLEPISTEKYTRITLPRKERWGLLVSKISSLANTESICAEKLKNIPLLISKRQEIKQLVEQWSHIPIKDLNVIGTYNLIFNIFSLVENNIGSAVVIEGAVSNRNMKNFKFIPLNPNMETNCVLAWKRNRLLTPLLKEFIKRFKEMI